MILRFLVSALSLGVATWLLPGIWLDVTGSPANAALLMLTSWVCAQFGVPWGVDGFWSAFWGALMVSIVSFVLNSFVGRRGEVHS